MNKSDIRGLDTSYCGWCWCACSLVGVAISASGAAGLAGGAVNGCLLDWRPACLVWRLTGFKSCRCSVQEMVMGWKL